MLLDYGSRDTPFVQAVREIRQELLRLAGTSQALGHECVLVQGSGTFVIEAVLSSAVGLTDELLVLANGAYGHRMARIAQVHGLRHSLVEIPEAEAFTAQHLAAALQQYPATTHVAVVHCETSAGVLNRAEELGELARQQGKVFILDSMSAFGGVEFDFNRCQPHFLVSSSNKCIEGVPGFAFVLAEQGALERCQGQARTVVLDLHAQWKGLEESGQFRFTPPVHVLMAFRQALRELEQEGGISARAARYRHNNQRVRQGFQQLGFRPYVPEAAQSPIITSFRYPEHPNWQFETFYRLLSERGFVLYPGKLTLAQAFRVGNIGQIYPSNIDQLLAAAHEVLAEMGVQL
jgi:2-aminoethylphosphonate-pyruvate transaminase